MFKLLNKLSKFEILSLPGFKKCLQSKFRIANENLTVRQLKPILKKSIRDLDIDFRGVRVRDYVKRIKEIEEAQKKSDEELFKRISSKKDSLKKQKRSREQYKQILKENALFERSLMNMGDLYSHKPSESKQFFELLMNIQIEYTTSKTEDKDEYQDEKKGMMIAVNNHKSPRMNICVGSSAQTQVYYFCIIWNKHMEQACQQLHKRIR